MFKLYSIYHLLFCFIVGNMAITVADILLMYILRAKVNLNNRIELYRISLFTNIIINFYGIWGFALRVDNSIRIPGLFKGGDFDQTHYWKILNMTIQVMIWLRLIVVIWYSFFVAMAIVCLPFFFIIGVCTGDLTFIDNNQDKIERLPGVKKFLERNSRSFNEKKDGEGTCSICLDDFANSKNKLISQLNCSGKHVFHKQCLEVWIEKNDICPLCREPVLDKQWVIRNNKSFVLINWISILMNLIMITDTIVIV